MLSAIAHVNTAWTLAAFAIAATIGALKAVLATTSAVQRRGRPAPPLLASSLVWPIVIAICFLGGLPILANAYLEKQRMDFEAQKTKQGVYRVRVTVLDPDGNPVNGATLHTTASNETTVTSLGTALVTIPRVTMPTDGKIIIFADLESAFLHGRADLVLAADFNPSITIPLTNPKDATVTGLVEDDNGRAIRGAAVSVLGGGSGETSSSGGFTLRTNTASGQMVQLHAEKAGYRAADQEHPAGGFPVTIVLTKDLPR